MYAETVRAVSFVCPSAPMHLSARLLLRPPLLSAPPLPRPPSNAGSLLHTGGRVKTWKRRWFILTDNCLYYFEYTTVSTGSEVLERATVFFRKCAPLRGLEQVLLTLLLFSYVCVHNVSLQDKEPRGIIPLENLSIREVEDKKPVRTAPSGGQLIQYTHRHHTPKFIIQTSFTFPVELL